MQHLLTDSRYLNDEVPSTTYFDDEGFFKTGDLAHKLNDHFIFDGRASIDCEFTQAFNCHIFFSSSFLMRAVICNSGGTVSVLKLEEALNGLSCIEEAYVVPVQDQKLAERAGALVRFVDQDLTLQQLRARLAPHVRAAMLPTALRVLRIKDTLPRTHSGKISKRALQKQFFLFTPGVGLPNDVELCNLDFD
jgi:malonyl-CoA/methylmalonyl-CoA synthetase